MLDGCNRLASGAQVGILARRKLDILENVSRHSARGRDEGLLTMKTRCSECGCITGHFASCPRVRDTPQVQVNRIEGRQYSGLLWIDDSDNSTNFKFNIAGGDFASARQVLGRFIAILQKRLDDESKCPFYKSEEELMKPSKYARLQYAALACAEFFRDELQMGDIESLSPRIAGYMKDLKTLCFDALGDPLVVDAAAIRRKVTTNDDKAATQ